MRLDGVETLALGEGNDKMSQTRISAWRQDLCMREFLRDKQGQMTLMGSGEIGS